jgi:hypothetical protein
MQRAFEFFSDLPQDIESADFWQSQIEQNTIRMQLPIKFNALRSIAGFAGNLDRGTPCQHRMERDARQKMIFHYKNSCWGQMPGLNNFRAGFLYGNSELSV